MAGHGRPGIIVIQEWWGLNDQICGVADRFARAGWNALAPDLYKGRLTASPDEANHLMTGLDFPDATHQDLRGAALHLQQHSDKVAVMGFCMGGALTIAAAVHVHEVEAAVCFYGIPPKEFADPAKIRVPFQGHFANRDDWCTPALVDDLEKTLKAAGSPPRNLPLRRRPRLFQRAQPSLRPRQRQPGLGPHDGIPKGAARRLDRMSA